MDSEFDIVQFLKLHRRAEWDDYYAGMDDAELAVQLGLEGL